MFNAFAMYLMLLFACSWLSPAMRRRLAGMGLFTDISLHAGLQFMFGGDADGRVAMLFAGLMFNLTMHAYRWYAGYTTFGGKRVLGVRDIRRA